MWNCLFGGFEEEPDELIKVITSNGGIMEFSPPISARNIVDELPGCAIFPSNDRSSRPLLHHEQLLPGKSPYYLLPLDGNNESGRGNSVRSDGVRVMVPYRMSCDLQGTSKRSRRLYKYENNDNPGIWKVKLVIKQEQLLETLSEETRTGELIESVRTVAKCGKGVSITSVGFSDQSSQSSNENATSKFKPRLLSCSSI